MVLLVLGVLGRDTCIGIDLQLAAYLFVRLSPVLFLSLVTAAWIVCVSSIKRAKRRMALAPSLLRLGVCRASDVLVCGDKGCMWFVDFSLGVEFGCFFLPDLVLLFRVTKCLLCLAGKSVVESPGKLVVEVRL